MFTFSIVIETENLGMAGVDDLYLCLDSLAVQTLPVTNANEVIIIVGGHITQETLAEIQQKYTWVKIHKEDTFIDYTRAKELGAKLATGDIVLFADADVIYEDTWVESLVNTFIKYPNIDIVSGYTRVNSGKTFLKKIYTTAINLTWMFSIQKINREVIPSTAFQFNNMAVKKNIFDIYPIMHEEKLYRYKITCWKNGLATKHITSYQIFGANGYHAPPATIIDWFLRMLIFSSDAVIVGNLKFVDGLFIEQKNIKKRVINYIKFLLYRIKVFIKYSIILVKEDSKNIIYIFLSLPICYANFLLFIIGGGITIVNQDIIRNAINKREAFHVV